MRVLRVLAYVVLFPTLFLVKSSGENLPPLTVEGIWAKANQPGQQPQGIQWEPDGARVTYLSADADLIQLQPLTAASSVLVSHTKLSALASAISNEKDKDHRARYGMSSYLWAPDSKHILFDSAGELFLYTVENGTAVDIASTGSGSGEDPKFSPNGQYLSYIRNHNLYLHRFREQSAEVPLTKTHEETLLNGEVDWVYLEELEVRSNYFWSPDSTKIAYMQMNEVNVPEYPITDWIPVHSVVDRQRYPQAGDPNPQVQIGVVKPQGGKTQWIKLPIEQGNDYIPRFGWVNAGTLWIETLTRDHKHRSLYFADAQRGDSKLAFTETDDKFIDNQQYDVSFMNSDFYLTSWRDGHNHIYRYQFDQRGPLNSTGTEPAAHLVKQLTSGNYEVQSIALALDNAETLYYVSNEGDPRERQIWSIRTDGSGKQRISTVAGVHSPIFAPHSPTYIDTSSSRLTPPQISLCHGADCKSVWKAAVPDGVHLTASEPLQLIASDGATRLYGELLLPPETTARAVPLIVNPYGGPGVQTVVNAWGNMQNRLWDQLLLQHGFGVLHVDNRGMSNRGRDFEQAAYRDFGRVQLADQLAAIDQVLAAHPQLDSRRLGWWGWSWGGMFTLNAMSHSDRFRAGVSVAPVTDLRNYDSVYTERYLGLPAENAEVYREGSVVNSANELKGRLLLVHGTGDDNVHLSNSMQYIQKLIDAAVPYDLQIYPRKTHAIAGVDARTHLYNRILAHFESYLKPPPEGGGK